MSIELDVPETTGGPCTICGAEWWTAEGSEPEDHCHSCRSIRDMASCHYLIQKMGYTRIYFLTSQDEADFYGVPEPGTYASNGSLPYTGEDDLLNKGPQVLAISVESEALAKHRASGSEGYITFPSWYGTLRELRILEEAGWHNPALVKVKELMS